MAIINQSRIDNLFFTENHSLKSPIKRTTVDSFSFSEVITSVSPQKYRNLIDSITLVETLRPIPFYSLFETVTISEVLRGPILRSITDTLVFTETRQVGGAKRQVITDSLVINELVRLGPIYLAINDTLVISESLILRTGYFEVSDSLAFSEQAIIVQSVIHLFESISFTDSVSRTRFLFDDSLNFIESVQLGDRLDLTDLLVFSELVLMEPVDDSDEQLLFHDRVCVCLVFNRPIADTLDFIEDHWLGFLDPLDPRGYDFINRRSGITFSGTFKKKRNDSLIFVENIGFFLNDIDVFAMQDRSCCAGIYITRLGVHESITFTELLVLS